VAVALFYRCCCPIKPRTTMYAAGSDRVGFHHGTRMMKTRYSGPDGPAAPVAVMPVRSFIKAPLPEKHIVKQSEEPTRRVERKPVTWPSSEPQALPLYYSAPPTFELPANKPLRPVLTEEVPFRQKPFLVRHAPQQPCWHCETGNKSQPFF